MLLSIGERQALWFFVLYLSLLIILLILLSKTIKNIFRMYCCLFLTSLVFVSSLITIFWLFGWSKINQSLLPLILSSIKNEGYKACLTDLSTDKTKCSYYSAYEMNNYNMVKQDSECSTNQVQIFGQPSFVQEYKELKIAYQDLLNEKAALYNEIESLRNQLSKFK